MRLKYNENKSLTDVAQGLKVFGFGKATSRTMLEITHSRQR
jgi:hypothetical protein